jgi:hypothetical protein
VGVPTGTPGELWTWASTSQDQINASTPAPVAQPFVVGQPFELLPQEVALFESYPHGGQPVTVTTAGFSSVNISAGIPRWYVSFDGWELSTNDTTNLTAFLPAGTFSVGSSPIPLNHSSPISFQNTERVPKQRLFPLVPSTLVVGDQPANLTIPFVVQWSVNATASAGGYVGSAPSWWDSGTNLTLSESAGFDRVFEYWEGFGAGSVNSTDPTVVVRPTSWIAEHAVFKVAYPVTFVETGLPAGTPWSVSANSRISIHGVGTKTTTSDASTTDVVSLLEANGTHQLTLGQVPGYRSSIPPKGALNNSSFVVSGAPLTITVQYSSIGPPPPRYAVTFEESGLPTGTSWSVTTRNVTAIQVGNHTYLVNQTIATYSTSSTNLTVYETNGTYGYLAISIPGWHAHNASYGFSVNGPGDVLNLSFYLVTYRVAWVESGLGPNLTWTVDLDGSPIYNNASWVTIRLPNGTYYFRVPNEQSFIPQLRDGHFTVNGTNVTFATPFVVASSEIVFSITGGPSGAPWGVRVGNLNLTTDSSTLTLSEPNGSYTFDVRAPSGYYAIPSHGTLSIDGQTIRVLVTMFLIGLPPVPPYLTLAVPAIFAATTIAVAMIGTHTLGRRLGRRKSAT